MAKRKRMWVGEKDMLSRNIGWRDLRLAAGITTLAILLIAGDVGAIPVEEWNKTFRGTGSDGANSVQQTSDGGYVVAGYTSSYGAGEDDAWLIKTDGNGNEEWNKTFGGSSWDRAYSVQQTSDGGYILAGSTSSYGAGLRDAWLIKTDAKGNEEWNETFGGANDDFANSVWQASDGGYIIVGGAPKVPDIPSPEQAYTYPCCATWIVKTDVKGNEQWNKTFRGGKLDYAYSVQQTSEGGYIFAGSIYGVVGPVARLIKTDANGNQQWSQEFLRKSERSAFPYESGEAHSVQQTSDGGYIIAGYTKLHRDNGDVYLSDVDILLIKTDENGNEQWNKTFGGEYEDEAFTVLQIARGGYVISGSKCSINAERCDEWFGSKCTRGAVQCDAWLIRTDVNGNELWNRTFGGTEDEIAYQVQLTRDGGYILAGYKSYGAASSDAWLIKVSGEPTASPTEKATGFEAAESITIILFALIIRRKRSN